MQNFKKLFFFCLAVNLNYNFIYGFSTPKFISNLWQKKEQEIINKEFKISNEHTLEIDNIDGDINIKTLTENILTIEAIKKGTQEELKDTKISLKNNESKTTIKTLVDNDKDPAIVSYNIIVGEKTNLIIKNLSTGSIKIKHVYGSIDAYTADGDIDIIDSTNTVSAKSDTKNIKVKQKNFSEPHSIFLEANKNINLFLPQKTNANILAKTQNGLITSQLDITINPITMKLNKETFNKLQKDIKGTLGTGGAPITIESIKGNISINQY